MSVRILFQVLNVLLFLCDRQIVLIELLATFFILQRLLDITARLCFRLLGCETINFFHFSWFSFFSIQNEESAKISLRR